MPTNTNKVLWVAGSRGEALLLGPLYLRIRQEIKNPRIEHTFALSGEQGMAAYQTIDGMGLRPHVEMDLRHPGDDSAIRLHAIMGDVEQVARERRVTHIIHAGRGATPAAAALVAHSRPCRPFWIRPDDIAGLVPRLDWERGLERMIESLTPSANIAATAPGFVRHALTTPDAAWPAQVGAEGRAFTAVEGRRAGREAIIVSVNRRIWGMTQFFGPLVAAAAEWARALPETDVIVFSGLDMRLEAAVRSMKGRPNNLLLAQPIPLPAHLELLKVASAVVTDSPMLAAESLTSGIPTVTVGEFPPEESTPRVANHLAVTSLGLIGPEAEAFLTSASPPAQWNPAIADPNAFDSLVQKTRSFIDA